MTDQTVYGQGHPGRRSYRIIGTDPDGQPIYAEVVALEPGSIGSGGGGVAGSVTIADATTSTQKAAVDASGRVAVAEADGANVALGSTSDASSANTLVGLLKAIKAAITGTLTVAGNLGRSWNLSSGSDSVNVGNFPATQPVSGSVSVSNFPATQPVSGTVTADTELPTAVVLADNMANPTVPQLGAHAMVWDSVGSNWDRQAQPLTDAQLRASAVPVSGPLTDTQLRASAVPVDVNDRSARLLGHVTLDNAVLHIDDNAGSLTVDGTVTANQGGAPWAENITQIGGSAIALKALPAGGDGQAAIPVYNSAIELLTYDAGARAIVSGALTANTAKAILSIEHGATSTKTVKIRRIIAHMIQTTALSGLIEMEIHYGTAASSAGTTRTPTPRRHSDAAAEAVVKTLPTITAATVQDTWPLGGFATTTTLYSPPMVVYDWQESGEMKPLILRAGVLEAYVLNVISTAAHNLTISLAIDFTEE